MKKKVKVKCPKKLVLVRESLRTLSEVRGLSGTSATHCTHFKTCTC
ncbi:MAG TPA: hypothetical protein VGR07_20855 [Thermoanaerobaculia bacterium]|nr:hypothetical protein [Thermoanaerobaculia bacterium]